MSFIKHIQEFEVMPKYYGFVKYDFSSRKVVIAPIPFHIIIRFAGLFLTWFKLGITRRASKIEKLCLDSYQEGFEKGFKEGFACPKVNIVDVNVLEKTITVE